uniref:Uncharacterized protein n=1 Tax=Plectus sambesii TaxID=2011161 RepID=A0A914X5P7_9BILA
MSAEVVQDVYMSDGAENAAKLGHLFSAFRSEAVFNDDGHFTFSSTEQKRIEEMVSEEFDKHVAGELETPSPVLHRELHATFLRKSLQHLTRSYEVCQITSHL